MLSWNWPVRAWPRLPSRLDLDKAAQEQLARGSRIDRVAQAGPEFLCRSRSRSLILFPGANGFWMPCR